MNNLTSGVTTLLSWFAVLAQVFVVAVLVALVFAKKIKILGRFKGFLAGEAVTLCFGAATLAVLGSLFYSEIAGYEPCSLCWVQRIFIFPQFFLFLVAFTANRKDVFKYALALAVPGMIVSAYHYYVQAGGINFLTCGAGEGAVSCSKLFVIEYGYITLPLMAFLTSLVIGLVSFLGMRKDGE